ncbi:MAG: methyltransferase domain-containing protein [Armatimonadota bacterium]
MDKLQSVITCLYCGGELVRKENKFNCSTCGENFTKEDKVWDFLHKELSAGMGSSQNKEVSQKLKEIEVFEDVEAYNELMSRPYLRALKEDILKKMNPPEYKGKNILELGSGYSLFLKEFPEDNFIVASDINKELLKQNEREDVNYMAMDAEKLPFKSGTFDLVYIIGVLHHLPNPEMSLEEVKRVVKDSGVIFINEPAKWSMNLIYYLIRRAMLLVFGEKFLKKLIGCGTPDESFVDLKQILEVFPKKEYDASIWRILPLRMPPVKIMDSWEFPVKVSRMLEKVPVINLAGTIVSVKITRKA